MSRPRKKLVDRVFILIRHSCGISSNEGVWTTWNKAYWHQSLVEKDYPISTWTIEGQGIRDLCFEKGYPF